MKQIVYRLYTTLREHEQSCSFFNGFGLLNQSIMGLIIFSSLIVKWRFEKPRRESLIFFLDTSKQIITQLTQHVFNILVSTYIGDRDGVQCEWYIVNLLNDLSIGLIILYMILKLFTYMFTGTQYEFHSGEYGSNILWKYFTQLIMWIMIVIIVIVFKIVKMLKYFDFDDFQQYNGLSWKIFTLPFSRK
jgi:hypothetical protein